MIWGATLKTDGLAVSATDVFAGPDGHGVFNTLGQEVAQLVNGDIEAGYHEVLFNAGNLASGVYFYRLQAAGFIQTRRLCVIR